MRKKHYNDISRKIAYFFIGILLLILPVAGLVMFRSENKPEASAASDTTLPDWWSRYQYFLNNNPQPLHRNKKVSATQNIDVSNEDGPQSETSIAVNPVNPKIIVAGSNDINRLPMRSYFSSDGGTTWGDVDVPLPPPTSTNGTDFGTDPGIAFDSHGYVYYSFLVVFFNRSMKAVQGSEVAVAKSTDGGQTWPQVTYFNYLNGGGTKFNDKPMIAVDSNPGSPYHDSIYVGWDNSSTNGKSSSDNALLFARSTDGGKSFSSPVTLNALTGGPNGVIGADPFVGPNGEVYVAWHDIQNNQLMFATSRNGGASFGAQQIISSTKVAIDDGIPAMLSRRALLYPACDTDRSKSVYKGALYCSWMDETGNNGTDVFVARSTDGGMNWSAPVRVNDDPVGVKKDQFNQWLSVDPTSGFVYISWIDARNDPADIKTDYYLSKSTNGGTSFNPNVKVTNAMTDESANNACANANDQYGDYEGISALNGIVHPAWTDGRYNCTIDTLTGLSIGEEIFTSAISL